MQIFNTDTYRTITEYFKSSATEIACLSNPISSIFYTVLPSLTALFPSKYDTFLEYEFDDYALNHQNKDLEIERTINLYNRFGVSINPLLEGAEQTREKIKTVTEKYLSLYYDLVTHFNQNQISNSPVHLAFELNNEELPFEPRAVGGNSFFAAPLILVSLPLLNIKSEQDLYTTNQNMDKASQRFSFDQKEQSFTHELSHLQNNTGYSDFLFKAATTCAHIWLWYSSYFQLQSWADYIAATSLKSLALEATSLFAYSFFSCQCEKREFSLSNLIDSSLNITRSAFEYLTSNLLLTPTEMGQYVLNCQNKDSDLEKALFLENFFGIDIDPSLEQAESTLKKIMDFNKDHLSSYIDIIQNFNKTRTPESAIHLVIKHESNLSFAAAHGGNFSLSNPTIEIEFPPEVAKSEQDLIEINQRYDQAIEKSSSLSKREFILTHELMHIQNNDCLSELLVRAAITCTNIWLWYSAYFQSQSWISYLLTNTLKSAAIAVPSLFTYTLYSRQHETNADLQAVALLKTNAGAKIFFESLIKLEEAVGEKIFLSLSHPRPEDRLEAVMNFSLDKTKTEVSI